MQPAYDYKGGNDTVGVFMYEQGDATNNETLNITYYYSDFYKIMPYSWTTDVFFLPKTNSSKNVTAYGQTTIKPIYNITTTNYGGKNLNLSVRVDETFACLNLSYNATGNTKPTNQRINTTWQKISSNQAYGSNINIWMWADLTNCNASDQRILTPQLDLASYCLNCKWEGS